MKIVHTSDWHIGQTFYSYDREAEHLHFFDQLATLLHAEHPDALVVSGDIYNTPTPSATAMKMLADNVVRLHDASPQTIIVITAGNHDSGSRLEAERALWLRLGVHVIGGCERRPDGTFDPAQFVIEIADKGYVVAAPHFYPSTYPPCSVDMPREDRTKAFYAAILDAVADKRLPVVLMAHLAVQGCDTTGHDEVTVGGMPKEDIKILGDGYDYLALGHIHKPQRLSQRAYYSGSPFPLSFAEDYAHYVNVVEIHAHGETPEVRTVEMDMLRKVKTLPPDGAHLEDALNVLAEIAPDDRSYIRLYIDQEGQIDADAYDRARLAAEGKECRFCEIYLKPRKVEVENKHHIEINEVDEFTSISPLEIAKLTYQTRNKGKEMRESLINKMRKAIDNINTTDKP